MRDLFDDFMDELRKREAAARGEPPDSGSGRSPNSGDPDEPDGDEDDTHRTPDDASDDGNGDADEAGDEDPPRPISEGPRRAGGRGRGGRRPPGGAPMTAAVAGRPEPAGAWGSPHSPSSHWRCSCCSAWASTCGRTRCGTTASASTRSSGRA